MLKKIAENIYSKEVPLPNNPLRYINVYIIKGDDGRSLIIDTGFNRPECENALKEAFDELGIKSPDVFITHLHSDHVGLVPKFAGEGSTIYSSETDGEIINFETGNLYWYILDDMFIKYGFPPADFGRNTDIHPGRKYVHESRIDFSYVSDGDVLEYGGYRLEVIETPGHTPGLVGLYDRKNGIYFCGDHILGTITPNITIEISADNPLKDYLESLEKVKNLDVKMLLTAHGTEVVNMYERIEELKKHHEARLAEVQTILGDKWKTAYECARDMTWEIDCRNWDEFPAPQKWFATGEAISHLQYLYSIGKVDRDELEGDIYYYKNKVR